MLDLMSMASYVKVNELGAACEHAICSELSVSPSSLSADTVPDVKDGKVTGVQDYLQALGKMDVLPHRWKCK